MPQWSVTFPGLDIFRADMLYTHGVTPSVCVVTCVPEQSSISSGDLVFRQDGSPLLTFRNCAVALPRTLSSKVHRGVRLRVSILDRRWKWKYQQVSGRFNRRDTDNTIISSTSKSYRELIEHVLEALGESNPQITLPSLTVEPPPVDWDAQRADLVLADLLEQVGCLVFLGPDDRAHVVPIGDGTTYPPSEYQLTPVLNFVPTNTPYKVQAIGGPTVYQCELTLEAVGLDSDGSVKRLRQLSYATLVSGDWNPAYIPGSTGKATFSSESTIADTTYSYLAQATVYKWYRVSGVKTSGLSLPDGNTLSSVDDLLPLLETLVTSSNAPSPVPYVTGTVFDPFSGTSVALPVKHDFDLDREHGIIRFREYVYDASSTGFSEPTIYLTAAFYARESPSHGLYRSSGEVVVSGDDAAGKAVLRRSDLSGVTEVGSTDDVTGDLVNAASAYSGNYNASPQATVEWVGLQFYQPAGNIHQMRWLVDGTSAKTFGGKNVEDPTYGPAWRERRVLEIVSEGLPC